MPSFGLVECNHVFAQKSIHFTVNSLRTSRLQFWQPWKVFLPKIRKTKAHLWETNIQTLFLPHKNLTSSKQLSGHVESNFGKRAGKISEKSPKICPSNIPEIFLELSFRLVFSFSKNIPPQEKNFWTGIKKTIQKHPQIFFFAGHAESNFEKHSKKLSGKSAKKSSPKKTREKLQNNVFARKFLFHQSDPLDT